MSTGVVDSGSPSTPAECLMHTIVMILSLFLFAYAIGVVSSIQEAANERALQYQAPSLPRSVVKSLYFFLLEVSMFHLIRAYSKAISTHPYM